MIGLDEVDLRPSFLRSELGDTLAGCRHVVQRE
jgi:hypothetical protein